MSTAKSAPVPVTVTGGDGRIATLLRARLPERFAARWLSRTEADVTDLAVLERAFAGADAVVHLAANANADASWEDVHAVNVAGTYNVFEAARRAGVGRVVFASSNHAMGMYLHDAARFADPVAPVLVGAEAPVRPDSLYGASKAWVKHSDACTRSATACARCACASGGYPMTMRLRPRRRFVGSRPTSLGVPRPCG